jgi:hypothetical protein
VDDDPTASPTARRAEEVARERARVEAYDRTLRDRLAVMERKLDGVITGGAFVAPPIPTPEVLAIRDLARKIGRDEILLPTAVRITRTLTEDGEEATHIGFDHLTFSIENALRLNVLFLDGRFNYRRAGELLHDCPPPGWVRPNYDAARPAARPRV